MLRVCATRGAAAFLAVALCLNVATASFAKKRLLSNEEILANMSTTHAMNLVLGSPRLKPELASLIQAKVAHRKASVKHLRAVKRHTAARRAEQDPAEETGYGALEGAMTMLNEMMGSARQELEISYAECGNYEKSQMKLLEETAMDLQMYNGMASKATAGKLGAVGQIKLDEKQLDEVGHQKKEEEELCEKDLAALRDLLQIVNDDLEVMMTVLNMTECKEGAAASLLQVSEFTNKRGMAHCPLCGRGGMSLVQNGELQLQLNRLKSDLAHKYLQQEMGHAFHESLLGTPSLPQTQAGAPPPPLAMGGASALQLHARHGQDPPEEGQVQPNASDIGVTVEVTEPVTCEIDNKCTLSDASCTKLRERFLLVHGGIAEKKEELEGQIYSLENECETTINNLKQTLDLTETDLDTQIEAKSQYTAQKSDATNNAKVKAQSHADMSQEYVTKSTECCDTQNALRSEACAIKKIRGELLNVSGQSVFVVDCEVSDWKVAGEGCSASCGGGTISYVRDVLVQPAGGLECPALEKQEDCNTFDCPVDCVLDSWSRYGECDAKCGGGNHQRMRSVLTPPENGGMGCGATQESEQCNLEACDADCVLAEWTEWETCSKACNKGSSRRMRGVAEPERGTGTCPDPQSEERLQFRPCNDIACSTVITDPSRSILMCDSKVDIVLLLDGSGSIGSYGWYYTRIFGYYFLKMLETHNDKAQVAVQVFSTGVSWIKGRSEFGTDVDDLALQTWYANWPAGGTNTHTALGMAQEVLTYGRKDAMSVVVVITDGYPNYEKKTIEAAEELQQQARVVWIPVGAYAPLELIEQLASKPKEEHIVKMEEFDSLAYIDKFNAVMATTCPSVK